MKLWLKNLLILLLFAMITVGGMSLYGFTIYNQSASELQKTYESYGDENNVIGASEPLTILLIGVDTGRGSRPNSWSGNSDTMILLTVNPKTKKTIMMSLERDILTNIHQFETVSQAKLNSAYATGGAELAIATVQELMNIHIDRYMLINMEGLVQLIDAVDGVMINNTLGFPISIETNEPEYTEVIDPGVQVVNGEQALVYTRMRYEDPEGDYGRQKRQREVIQRVVEKILSFNSVSHYQRILSAISNNMKTNIEINPSTIPQLLGYQDALRKVSTYQLGGESATLLDGGSYQIVTREHLLEMQNILRISLGMKELSELKTSAVLYETFYGNDYNGYDTYVEGNTNISDYTFHDSVPVDNVGGTVPPYGFADEY